MAASLGRTGALMAHAHYLSFGSDPTEMNLSKLNLYQAVSPECLECGPLIFFWAGLKTKYFWTIERPQDNVLLQHTYGASN
jgi:hypothetical protein